MQTLLDRAGLTYMVGGFLFSIALFRTSVMARWTAARRGSVRSVMK